MTSIALAMVLLAGSAAAAAAEPPPLVLEAKIPLGDVRGRIDHLAVDVEGRRLFVAELGNDSVGVVDLAARKLVRTIAGMKEPQGVGYFPATGTLYVANAGDGSVRLFEGAELAPGGRIDLGDDADNVRVDPRAPAVVVGYGSGALAIIDPTSRKKIADITLAAHPEGFQLSPDGARAYVNLPGARQIAVLDRAAGKVARTIPTGSARGNFPMALDPGGGVLTVFRDPPRLASFAADGTARGGVETCGDADDVFVDARRNRVYVSCGAGFIEVFERKDAGFARLAHIATVSGARTALLVPELDRLFLAVRAQGSEPAAIWEFRPAP